MLPDEAAASASQSEAVAEAGGAESATAESAAAESAAADKAAAESAESAAADSGASGSAAADAESTDMAGASGDVGPMISYSADPASADRNGRMLGYAACSAIESLLPPGTGIQYEGAIVSGATLAGWSEAPVDTAGV
ncbi:MAG: hypothetical protein ACPHE0_02975, partial [Pseudomonadales bacterium]